MLPAWLWLCLFSPSHFICDKYCLWQHLEVLHKLSCWISEGAWLSSLLKSSICLLGMEGMHGTSELCICTKKMRKVLDMSLSPWHRCDLQLSHLISSCSSEVFLYHFSLFSLLQKTHSSLLALFLQQLDTHDASYLYFFFVLFSHSYKVFR